MKTCSGRDRTRKNGNERVKKIEKKHLMSSKLGKLLNPNRRSTLNIWSPAGRTRLVGCFHSGLKLKSRWCGSINSLGTHLDIGTCRSIVGQELADQRVG